MHKTLFINSNVFLFLTLNSTHTHNQLMLTQFWETLACFGSIRKFNSLFKVATKLRLIKTIKLHYEALKHICISVCTV